MSLERLQEFRMESAKQLVEQGNVKKYSDDKYVVKSQTTEHEIYDVIIVHGKYFVCTCPDYDKRSKNLRCKHELAVELFINHHP